MHVSADTLAALVAALAGLVALIEELTTVVDSLTHAPPPVAVQSTQ